MNQNSTSSQFPCDVARSGRASPVASISGGSGSTRSGAPCHACGYSAGSLDAVPGGTKSRKTSIDA